MRSRSEGGRRRAAALAAALVLSCGPLVEVGREAFEERDQSLTKTCEKVWGCGEVVAQDVCETELEDLIEDGRITEERAVACAACMADNQCSEIQVGRHCDVACAGVGFVETLWTTRSERGNACASVMSVCGDEDSPLLSCRDDWDECNRSSRCCACYAAVTSSVRQTRALDRELDVCATCIAETAGETPATPLSNDEACQRFITRCGETCDRIATLKEVFAKAEARFALQALATRLCLARRACDAGAQRDCGIDEAVAALGDPDGDADLLERAASCATCLETQPCDSASRDADCAGSCAGLP